MHFSTIFVFYDVTSGCGDKKYFIFQCSIKSQNLDSPFLMTPVTLKPQNLLGGDMVHRVTRMPNLSKIGEVMVSNLKNFRWFVVELSLRHSIGAFITGNRHCFVPHLVVKIAVLRIGYFLFARNYWLVCSNMVFISCYCTCRAGATWVPSSDFTQCRVGLVRMN